ncbi:unnamed protein product [Cuscuta campestris]|uniref:Non-specific lipid-transfer protein n=2 Tax=Cuscuta sect. Cleistogrammica TaxID=1824901 RepID=A0A484L492_9ASTE|nr:hypothetical protein DM860_016522 [Cuscuta australis]VFQ71141.1 unnamed protein product [Cuscuta campestris]
MASAVVNKSPAVWFAAAALCVLAVAFAPRAEAITCGQVASSLGPCLSYLRGAGGMPPPTCCSGVKSLNSMAQTTADRKTACSCLKSVAGSVNGLNAQTAAALPDKCGVSIPYAISMSTNCANVK